MKVTLSLLLALSVCAPHVLANQKCNQPSSSADLSTPDTPPIEGYMTEIPSTAEDTKYKDFNDLKDDQISSITVEQLDIAVPSRAGANSCDEVKDPNAKCVTNEKAVVAINNAMKRYNVHRKSHVVAMIAILATESVDWLYDTNQSSKTPGQGTRAMLMYDHLMLYAKSLHPEEYQKLTKGNDDSATVSNTTKNDVRELVLNDDDSFASAFWFLTKRIPKYYTDVNLLRPGSINDFETYCRVGIITTWNDNIETNWRRAQKALFGESDD